MSQKLAFGAEVNCGGAEGVGGIWSYVLYFF